MRSRNPLGRPKGIKETKKRRPRIARHKDPRAKAALSDVDALDEMLRIVLTYRDDAANGDKEAAGLVLRAASEVATYTKVRLKPMEYEGKLSIEQLIEKLSGEQAAEFLALIEAERGARSADGENQDAGPLDTGPGEPPATGSVH